MKIRFNLEYQTTFGEELMLNILAEGKTEQHKMGTLDGLHWMCELSKNVRTDKCIDYFYAGTYGMVDGASSSGTGSRQGCPLYSV